MATNSKAQQNIFGKRGGSQETSAKASCVLAFEIANPNKPFAEGQFLKDCLADIAGMLSLNPPSLPPQIKTH